MALHSLWLGFFVSIDGGRRSSSFFLANSHTRGLLISPQDGFNLLCSRQRMRFDDCMNCDPGPPLGTSFQADGIICMQDPRKTSRNEIKKMYFCTWMFFHRYLLFFRVTIFFFFYDCLPARSATVCLKQSTLHIELDKKT